jgi:hypothetical protein
MNYLAITAERLCDSGAMKVEWFSWGACLFEGYKDRAAAGRERVLQEMDKVAAQELSMLLDDESVAGNDEDAVTDMMSIRMGLGSESEGRDARDGSDEEDDKIIEVETEPETRSKASTKGKGKAVVKRKIVVEKVLQGPGKAKFYRTPTSSKVRR